MNRRRLLMTLLAVCVIGQTVQAEIWNAESVYQARIKADLKAIAAWNAQIEAAEKIWYWVDPNSPGWNVVWGWYNNAYDEYDEGDNHYTDGEESEGGLDWDSAGPSFAQAEAQYEKARIGWNIIADGLPDIPE